jgi:hypothetical protein
MYTLFPLVFSYEYCCSVTWPLRNLVSIDSMVPQVFYPMASFRATPRSQAPLPWPSNVLLSENYTPSMHRSGSIFCTFFILTSKKI